MINRRDLITAMAGTEALLAAPSIVKAQANVIRIGALNPMTGVDPVLIRLSKPFAGVNPILA